MHNFLLPQLLKLIVKSDLIFIHRLPRCRIFESILGLIAKDTMFVTEFVIYQDAEFLHLSSV